MHELSIAVSLVDLAQEEAERLNGSVVAVHLKLGRLSGVVSDALLFCYDVACQDTPLQGSKLVIEEMPIVVYCKPCDSEHALADDEWLQCPDCGAPTAEVRQGRELELVALEVEE